MRTIPVFPECRMDTQEYLRCFWVIYPQKNTLYFNSFIFYFYSYLLFFTIDSVFFHLLSCKMKKICTLGFTMWIHLEKSVKHVGLP